MDDHRIIDTLYALARQRTKETAIHGGNMDATDSIYWKAADRLKHLSEHEYDGDNPQRPFNIHEERWTSVGKPHQPTTIESGRVSSPGCIAVMIGRDHAVKRSILMAAAPDLYRAVIGLLRAYSTEYEDETEAQRLAWQEAFGAIRAAGGEFTKPTKGQTNENRYP